MASLFPNDTYFSKEPEIHNSFTNTAYGVIMFSSRCFDAGKTYDEMNLDELNENEDDIDEEEERIFEAYRYIMHFSCTTVRQVAALFPNNNLYLILRYHLIYSYVTILV